MSRGTILLVEDDPRDEELTEPPSARLSRLTPRAPTTFTT